MGMQSFRGAGGLGAYVSPPSNGKGDALGEHEHTPPLAQNRLTEGERRFERLIVGVATVLWIGIGALVAVWLV
jgi:hypothetical protein